MATPNSRDVPITWDVCRDWSVRDLRRRWRPTKKQLSAVGHPLPIRLHRAFSWMDAADQRSSDGPKSSENQEVAPRFADEQLVLRWIALNALYGKWDKDNLEPVGDNVSLKQFQDQVMDLDERGLIQELLRARKEAVISIVTNPYINQRFWRALGQARRFNPSQYQQEIERAYQREAWRRILKELLNRIYLVRNQLVHGAATYNGSLNRDVVAQCSEMLRELLVAFMVTIIDRGKTRSWGDLCYPPQHDEDSGSGNGSAPRNPK